ncbi:MAG: 50S ribosomal protein L24 [Nitrosopumilaceae archaeon]
MKPTIIRNRQFFQASNHVRSKQLGATLSQDLREKYGKRSARVVEGDTIRVMRGEFKGIDGKVTQISTEKNGVAVEGIKREKLKGGNVDIYIHTSNVMITGLNLDDKWRQNRLEGEAVKVITEAPKETPKEIAKEAPKKEESLKLKESPKPKEKLKEKSKEKPKETAKGTPEPKEKASKPATKKTKQTKAANQAKKETK